MKRERTKEEVDAIVGFVRSLYAPLFTFSSIGLWLFLYEMGMHEAGFLAVALLGVLFIGLAYLLSRKRMEKMVKFLDAR